MSNVYQIWIRLRHHGYSEFRTHIVLLYDPILIWSLIFYWKIALGSRTAGVWDTCVFWLITRLYMYNWQLHNTIIYHIGFGLPRTIEKSPKILITKNVEFYFFWKLDRFLRVVHSHQQRVWAHPGTAARTLTMGSGVSECTRVGVRMPLGDESGGDQCMCVRVFRCN